LSLLVEGLLESDRIRGRVALDDAAFNLMGRVGFIVQVHCHQFGPPLVRPSPIRTSELKVHANISLVHLQTKSLRPRRRPNPPIRKRPLPTPHKPILLYFRRSLGSPVALPVDMGQFSVFFGVVEGDY